MEAKADDHSHNSYSPRGDAGLPCRPRRSGPIARGRRHPRCPRHDQRPPSAGRLASRIRISRGGARPLLLGSSDGVYSICVPRHSGPPGSLVRRGRCGSAMARCPGELHREDRGDRLLYGRGVRAFARSGSWLFGIERQLRVGAEVRVRPNLPHRCLPDCRLVRPPGRDPTRRCGQARGARSRPLGSPTT